MRRLKYDGSFSVEDGTGEPGAPGSDAAGLSREPIVLRSGTTASAKASLRGVGVLEDVLSRFVDPYQTTDMCAARRLYEELRAVRSSISRRNAGGEAARMAFPSALRTRDR